MSAIEGMQTAMVNRSIRTIKAAREELEYLCDAAIISPQTLSDLLSRIPPQTALHAPLSVGAVPTATAAPGAPQPPTQAMNDLGFQNSNNRSNGTTPANGTMNEKSDSSYYQPPAAPPPAYVAPPAQTNGQGLAQATALYVYSSTDAGDLPLQPNDHVVVLEYMNAEWWKGRSTRTGQEGIFPRSYVKVVENAGAQQQQQGDSGYGNAPLEVSGMGSGQGQVPGKGQEMGKKFGKKLGNAAIFGAGATIGGNIVNSIF